ERYEDVLEQGKERQRDRDELIEEENPPERSDGFQEMLLELQAVAKALRDALGDPAECRQADCIRDRKGQQAADAELNGHLYREKQPQTPGPGQRNGESPEGLV